ncbi:hypothetical protein DPMN_008323 [Dreissena polymorpha]|uniref:Uncharacterized protein n=1 Tax=Dreissena polymorpha TaxID=45954 RepID=A0A9D4MVX2_DREPO|nr:hypothetical protein DPMN_008323 [Dreissena polymorpha]
MSLPFVPVEEIEPVLHSRFGSLTDERLLQLRKYIFDQWVNSTTFPPCHVERVPTRHANKPRL